LWSHASGGATKWEIPEAALTRLIAPKGRWETAYATFEDLAKRTSAVTIEKVEARKAFTRALRLFIKSHLTYNELVTDADRKDLGLPVHDTEPTPVGSIKSRPEVEVKFDAIQEHVLVVHDSETKSAGKPAGAAGFEVWRKVGGEPPASDEEWLLVVQATRSPHTLAYAQADVGKHVYYRLRWVNTRGVPGQWSEMVSAVIG
jgi:hypothetical protein